MNNIPPDQNHQILASMRSDVTNKMLESVQITARKKICNIITLFNEYKLKYKSISQQTNISIKWNIPIPHLMLLCAKPLIGSVLDCFIICALEHSKPNRTVSINVITEDEWVYTHIKDQGYGITPYDYDRFFNPKYSSDEHKNLTLDMYFAKKIIEFHNGKIFVAQNKNIMAQADNKSAKGITVTFALPVNGGD